MGKDISLNIHLQLQRQTSLHLLVILYCLAAADTIYLVWILLPDPFYHSCHYDSQPLFLSFLMDVSKSGKLQSKVWPQIIVVILIYILYSHTSVFSLASDHTCLYDLLKLI